MSRFKVPPSPYESRFGYAPYKYTLFATPPRTASSRSPSRDISRVSTYKSLDSEDDLNIHNTLDELYDAETGEKLTLTKDTWNAREGRRRLDYHSIIRCGTGLLNISRGSDIICEEEKQIFDNSDDILNDPDDEGHNATFLRFLMEGPLTASFNLTNNCDDIKTPQQSPDRNQVKPNSSAKRNNKTKKDRLAPLVAKQTTDPEIAVKEAKESAIIKAANASNSNAFLMTVAAAVLAAKDDDSSVGNRTEAGKVSVLSVSSNESSVTQVNEFVTQEQESFQHIYAIAKELTSLRNHLRGEKESSKKENQAFLGRRHGGLMLPPITGADDSRGNTLNQIDAKRDLLVTCHEINQRKFKNIREVKQAVADEAEREKRRQEIEQNLNFSSKYAKDTLAKHEAERQRARLYINALQYDNEVLIISKMKKEKMIW